MRIGYARVSTQGQNLGLQINALEKASCEEIFQEKESGAKEKRPELDKMLSKLRKGDTVIVWKLDRIGRNMKHLIELVEQFNREQIGFQSLNDPVDTTTASGRLTFNIFAALAEFEREILRERTIAGQDNARRKGKKIGRPHGLSKDRLKVAMMAKALKSQGFTEAEIANKLKVGRSTIYRYLKYVNARCGNAAARRIPPRPRWTGNGA